jgi:hypothetical protein
LNKYVNAWLNGKQKLISTTFAIAIKDVRDKFHWNFQVGYKVHHIRYKGVNVGFTKPLHIEVKTMAKARMHAK